MKSKKITLAKVLNFHRIFIESSYTYCDSVQSFYIRVYDFTA